MASEAAGKRTSPEAIADQIGEDLAFQRRMWRVQRIGWLVALALLVAAFLGAFGQAPLSVVTSASPDGVVSVTIERLARHGSPTSFELEVSPSIVREGKAAVWFDRDYLAGIDVLAILPTPSRVIEGSDRVGYEFEVDESAGDPVKATFQVEYDELWLRSGRVETGGSIVDFVQLIYP